MRIKKFHIKNYRSCLDSGEVTLDSKITTLMGKNESGKTVILKALESFRLDYEYEKDDLCLHSEARKKLDAGEIEERNIEIVAIWFEIEVEEKRKLKEIHPQLEKIKTLKCTKYFDNSHHIESPEMSLEELKINAQREIEKILTEMRESAAKFKEKLDLHAKRYSPFSVSEPQYNESITNIIDFLPEGDPNIDAVFNSFNTALRNLPNQDTQIQRDIETFIGEIDPHKKTIKTLLLKKEDDVTEGIFDVLPNFMYFADVEKLEDTVPISEFLADSEKHKTLSNLIELTGLNIEHVKDAEAYDMLTQLRSASMNITGLVNQSWTQEKVKLNIGIVRDEIVVSIFDDVIKKEHPPSIRSQGFQWFLSFYINFTAGSTGKFKNTVILLDDPGVYLHPSGQKDLLKTLEKISDSNQIIFSTHSPFMIEREKLDRIRIVSKQEMGTSIQEKFYTSDYDALQPLRASIGMTIGDSLFTLKKNVLVEGYSDELILEAMSAICCKMKKDYIDTNNISFFPVNGADKMPYFATLLTKENLKFVILLDHDPKGRRAATELRQRFNVNEENILTLNTIATKGNDLELEDLIDFDFFLKAVNLAYGDILQEALGKDYIDENSLQGRSFGAIKKFFREKKIGRSKQIDKIKVAKKIHGLVANDELPSDETISNFSQLFKVISNQL